MPRQPRARVTGYPIHIIQRGNDRKACFFADEDHRFFLDELGRLAKRFKCALHAYVLMTNHFHLLLTPEIPDGPSLLMKFLGQRYVQYVNKTYKRTGTLWEGRFRSSIVQSQHYLLGCYRYIELNPVRASMVRHPGEYPWSSYAVNAIGQTADWLSPHAEYLALGRTDTDRQRAYRALFNAHFDQEFLRDIRVTAHGGYALGDQRFREQIEQVLKRRATPRAAGRPRLKSPAPTARIA
jgi:putative transposase